MTNEKEQDIESLKKEKLEKYNNEDCSVVKIDCDCTYNHGVHNIHSTGYILLHEDGWFEGFINNIINESYYRFNDSKGIKYSEDKFIYGIYHEKEYIELLQFSPLAKVDPLAFRAINISDLSPFQKEEWLNEEEEEFYDMIGTTKTIGFDEVLFGYNYLKFQKINLSKNNVDVNKIKTIIEKMKSENIYGEIYDRMIAFKDGIDNELRKMYINKKMANLYLNKSKQDDCNKEQAITKVVDNEYMISDETAHKILKLRSLNFVKRTF